MLAIGTRVVRATDDHSIGILGTVMIRDESTHQYVVYWDDDSQEVISGTNLAVPYHQR